MIDDERMLERLRGALEEIRREGKVCDQYETCEHRSCRSSYTAWAIADEALGAALALPTTGKRDAYDPMWKHMTNRGWAMDLEFENPKTGERSKLKGPACPADRVWSVSIDDVITRLEMQRDDLAEELIHVTAERDRARAVLAEIADGYERHNPGWWIKKAKAALR